jgi:hypothetical protein
VFCSASSFHRRAEAHRGSGSAVPRALEASARDAAYNDLQSGVLRADPRPTRSGSSTGCRGEPARDLPEGTFLWGLIPERCSGSAALSKR